MEVQSDYKEGYDFSKVKTFAVIHKPKEGENSLSVDRIIAAIAHTLQAKGLKQTKPTQADLLFLFHLNVTNKTDIYTDYQVVGFGRRSTVIATPRSYNYDEGRLIIDAVDRKLKKTVYRVEIKDELKAKKTPKAREAYIQKAIQKALQSFPPS